MGAKEIKLGWLNLYVAMNRQMRPQLRLRPWDDLTLTLIRSVSVSVCGAATGPAEHQRSEEHFIKTKILGKLQDFMPI